MIRQYLLCFTLLVLLKPVITFSQKKQAISYSNYLPNTIIVKVKNRSNLREISGQDNNHFSGILSAIKTTSFKSFYKSQPDKVLGKYGKALLDFYIIHYENGENVEEVCAKLMRSPEIEVAEPYYLFKTDYLPNDPFIGKGLALGDTLQYYLERVHAFDGWNITKGDTNVVIGIVDDGTHFHEDTKGNIKYNYADPIDNIDNDNDGYIDNFQGWDIADMDNDPVANSHGAMVAGVCCAVPDNGKGIAGLGFNTNFLPIKASATMINGYFNIFEAITHGFEGITYAADHGVKVINCSWGGSSHSELMEAVINYASEEKDVVVVVSAGNDNSESPLYPAAYENSFSVAACSTVYSNEYNQWIDVKASFSSYGKEVDLIAPGWSMYTTDEDTNYKYVNGTSFSAPLVSAAAALIRGKYPHLKSKQVRELLRVTADVIDTTSVNQVYKGKLGAGKLNIYKALTQPLTPSVRLNNPVFHTLDKRTIVAGSIATMEGELFNYLNNTEKLYIRLSSETSGITIDQNLFYIGSVSSYQAISLPSDVLTFSVSPTTKYNQDIVLQLEYIDSTLSYHDFQYFYIKINLDYKTHTKNKITFTMGSNGRLGYVDQSKLGSGFIYEGNSLLDEAGLMIAYTTSDVSDCVRSDVGKIDEDFVVDESIIVKDSNLERQDFISSFEDKAGKIQVTQHSVASNKPSLDKLIVTEYIIKNISGTDLSNFYVGLFADWDIGNYKSNVCWVDLIFKLIYVEGTTTSDKLCAIAILSDDALLGNCLDNKGSSLNPNTDGFTSWEKYTSISTNSIQAVSNSDVSSAIGVQINRLNKNMVDTIAFGFLVADSYSELVNQAMEAKKFYKNKLTPIVTSQLDTDGFEVYPNPFTESFSINVSSIKGQNAEVKISNWVGEEILNQKMHISEDRIELYFPEIPSGLYVLEVVSEDKVLVKKLLKK
jgi:subtilisin family serine protease